jgi:hypothetical protein
MRHGHMWCHEFKEKNLWSKSTWQWMCERDMWLQFVNEGKVKNDVR